MKRFFRWIASLLKQDPPLQKGGVGVNEVNPKLAEDLKKLKPGDTVIIRRDGCYCPSQPPKNPIPPSERPNEQP